MKELIDRALLERDDFLRKMLALIVEHYSPEQVYLFGSRARGDAGPDSDYDFFVVVREKVPHNKQGEFYSKQWDARLVEPSDVVLWTKTSFEELADLKPSLPGTVKREGRLLYEAA